MQQQQQQSYNHPTFFIFFHHETINQTTLSYFGLIAQKKIIGLVVFHLFFTLL